MTALQTITATMQSWGWSPAMIAGAEGNLLVESKFDPTATNPKEGAVGIAQWEGGRRTALQSFARSRGTSETDLGTQLAFMHSELNGSESGAYKALLAASTPKDAATVWAQQYERSDPSSLSFRVSSAEGLAQSVGATEDPAGSYENPTQASGILGVFSGWQSDLAGLSLKIAAACIGGTLVVVGAYETLKNKDGS